MPTQYNDEWFYVTTASNTASNTANSAMSSYANNSIWADNTYWEHGRPMDYRFKKESFYIKKTKNGQWCILAVDQNGTLTQIHRCLSSYIMAKKQYKAVMLCLMVAPHYVLRLTRNNMAQYQPGGMYWEIDFGKE